MPTHLQRDAVLNWFGGKQKFIKLHAEWVADAKVRWLVEDD
jgi:hypothetical protein